MRRCPDEGLPQDRAAPLGCRTQWIAQVDLVAPSTDHQTVVRDDLVVRPGQDGSLVVPPPEVRALSHREVKAAMSSDHHSPSRGGTS